MLHSRENGDVGFYLRNRNLPPEKLSIIARIQMGGHITKNFIIEKVFEPYKSWGYDEFLKKDVLDNHMEGVVDKSGHLNIHLKICCKNTLFSDKP